MRFINKQFGFTLVELLIALSILSFVMVLCASGFKFGTRVWERVDSQSEHIDSLQAVQGFIRTSVSHALIRNRQLDDDNDEEQVSELSLENLFVGKPHQLSYVSYSPQYGIDDYLYRYKLYFNKQQKSLAIAYSPYNLKLKNYNQKPLSIIEGVKSLEIKYFSGFYSERDNSSWLDEWEDGYSLPLLIKINVVFIDETKQWPELVIPTKHGPYVVR